MAIIVSSGQVVKRVVVYDDSMYIYSSGTANATLVKDFGYLYVYAGGTANATILSSGGMMLLSPEALADHTTVSSGGRMYVYPGAAATYTIMNGAGSMYVYAGGLADNTRVDSGGRMYLSGATVNSASVSSNGTIYVSSGATVNSTTAADTGRIYVYKSGLANSTTLEGWGYLFISSGGSAYSTTMYGWGSMNIYNSGEANSTTANGGDVRVFSGGSADNTTLNEGYYAIGRMYVSSGGEVNNTTLNKKGYLYVYASGAASSTTVNGGGEMHVSSGGKITGSLTIAAGGVVSAYGGSIADFDVSTVAPGNAALYNDVSQISGSPNFTITVFTHQKNGTYTLAGGASDFSRNITVNTAAGTKIGTISVGKQLKFGNYTYSLVKSGSTLTLTVEGATQWFPPDDLNGDGRGDIIMTIAKEGHAAYGATGAWLIQENQTAAWGDLSQRNAGWEIFGTGRTAAGKSTDDVYLKSADNVVGAWTTDAAGKVNGWTTIGNFDADTQVLGLGDFDGNGQTDLLLRNTNGTVGCFLTDGTGWHEFRSLGNEWQIMAIGDLNGDGRDDMVLKNDAGMTGCWLTRANCSVMWTNLNTVPTGYSIVGTGDFNGDGISDVLLKKGNYYGAWIVRNGNVKEWMGLGNLGNITVEEIADFDGDGSDDLRIRTAAGDLGAQLVKGADKLEWKYYGSVGSEWSTSLASI